MLRRTKRRPRQMSSRPRGSVFIWFFTVSLFLFIIASFIAVDMSDVIIAGNEVQLAAESAALDGASQATIETTNSGFVGESYINAAEAESAVQSTFAAEEATGALPHADIISMTPTIVSDPGVNPNTVTVTVSYTVTNLLYAGYSFFTIQSPRYTASAEAFLCIPGDTGNAVSNESGVCTTPTN
jgi:Flp pilus assembly protein TadG